MRGGSNGPRREGTLLLVEGPQASARPSWCGPHERRRGRGGRPRLEARGSELEQPFPFGVVASCWRARSARRPGAAICSPARPHPRRGCSTRGAAGAGADGSFEALHSLYWLVVNLADRAPVLVLVDDCQWADRDSLRFLAYLAQRIDGLPMAIVLASRPPDPAGPTRAAVGQVASRPKAIALYPRPLSESAVVALIRERLGAEAAEAFCRSCHTATGGNPLFLRELLGAGRGRGRAIGDAAAEVQAVGPAAVALRPPSPCRARAIRERARPRGRRAGRRHRPGARRPRRRPHRGRRQAAADDLVRSDMFVRTERLGFVHPIVRAALYEDLAPGERQARHAAAAKALEHEGAPPERLTVHLLRTSPTGDPRRIATLRAAATVAARRGAPAAAAVPAPGARRVAPEQERAEILTELGRYEVAAMQFEAAEEHLRRRPRRAGA